MLHISMSIHVFCSELLQHLQGMSQQSHALGVGGFTAGGAEEAEAAARGAGVGGANSHGSDILDATSHSLRLEKSNVLLLGPTGSGKHLR